MKTLVRNIGLLAGIADAPRKEGAAMGEVECLRNAWLLLDGDRIEDFGGEAVEGAPLEGRATRGTEAGGPPRRGGGVSPEGELPKGELPSAAPGAGPL